MLPADAIFTAVSAWIRAASGSAQSHVAKTVPPQNAPMREGLFWVVNIINATKAGRDTKVYPSPGGTVGMNAQRLAQVSIHSFGPGAFTQMTAVEMCAYMPSITAILSAAQLGIARMSPAKNLTLNGQSRAEERGQMDVFINCGVTIQEDIDTLQILEYAVEAGTDLIINQIEI